MQKGNFSEKANDNSNNKMYYSTKLIEIIRQMQNVRVQGLNVVQTVVNIRDFYYNLTSLI